jgi:hypothetical protein
MFDLAADDGSVRKKRYKSPISDAKPIERPVKGNALDNATHVRLHTSLMGTYLHALERQSSNRIEMAIDEDYYDNKQWTEAEEAELEERGQMPLVFNVTATTVDWVLGTEKRSRSDFKILPRRKEDGKPAERKTELMKYLSDVNKEPYSVSRAFEDAVKAGVGWMEDGYQGDDEGEPIFSRYESWRNMLWDSTAMEPDLSDGRYVFRTKWLDLDVAMAMFPKRKALLQRSCETPWQGYGVDAFGDVPMDSAENAEQGYGPGEAYTVEDVTYTRRRVRVFECWFKVPVATKRLSGGIFAGEVYDEHSRGHAQAIADGDSEVIEKVAFRMHVALFTTSGMLWLSQSLYRHNKFPFTPIWGKRRASDQMPYGLVRNIRDIQSDINKRASKALHILSTNKVVMDEGAVDDITALMQEVARPDAVIVKKAGKELKLDADRELSQYHLDMMSRSIQMVQQVGGVTDEMLGRRSNAVSGVAIERRQDQGALATSKFFDNLRYAQQVRGEKKLSLQEQFMTEEKQFRITNKRGRPEWVKVNDGMPENDVTLTKADFIIDEDDWRATVRQAQVDALLELLGKLAGVAPQIIVATLDLIVESMDLPNQDEIVKRIRQITGQTDPDAEEPSQEQQIAAVNQQKQAELAERAALANIAKSEGDAKLSAARAEEIAAKVAGTKVDTQAKALGAASAAAIAAPGTADIADHILHESGFASRTEMEEVMRAQEQAAQEQAALLAAQQEAAAAQQAPGLSSDQPPAPPETANPAMIGLG